MKIKDLEYGYSIHKISKSRYAVFSPFGKSLKGLWKQFRSIKSAEVTFYRWYSSWKNLSDSFEV